MNDPRGDNYFSNEIAPSMEEKQSFWLNQARQTAIEVIRQHGQVSADDIHNLCPVPDDIEPRIMGCVFKTSQFKRIGYVAGKRSVRQIGVYALG
jgi:hypothetical protein